MEYEQPASKQSLFYEILGRALSDRAFLERLTQSSSREAALDEVLAGLETDERAEVLAAVEAAVEGLTQLANAFDVDIRAAS